jgi:uncharacterized membrane protein YkoI
MKRTIAVGFAVIIVLAASGGGWARSRDRYHGDNDLARSALQRGEVLPITRILPLVAQYLPGDVVEVRLDSKRGGRLHYEIKVLTPSGHIRELVLDARTGEYVAIED